MIIKFTIPGPPKGKGRPRFARRGNSVTTYTPQQTVEYERTVKWSWRAQSGQKFERETPIEVRMVFFMPIPKSLSKKKQLQLDGTFHSKKSDIDNLIKAILDGCNGLAYSDDAQISSLTAEKRYSFEPRTEVIIKSAGSDDEEENQQ